MSIDVLKDRLPDYARDLKLNLVEPGVRAAPERRSRRPAASSLRPWPPTTRRPRRPWSTPSARELSPEALNAAKIAASLMAMNNIYYRFVHLVHAADYKTLPARLRMNAMAKPGVDKVDFELWSLAVSAINGCGMCLEAHEKVCATTAFPRSRSRPRCASPRPSTPSRARSVQKRRWRRRRHRPWPLPPRLAVAGKGA